MVYLVRVPFVLCSKHVVIVIILAIWGLCQGKWNLQSSSIIFNLCMSGFHLVPFNSQVRELDGALVPGRDSGKYCQ